MTIRIDGTNTAANPGITGTDTDTGLQFGTDEVNIVTGGTSRVTVDSDGAVGIGVEDPSAYYAENLVVWAGTEGGITIRNANTTTTNYLMFATANSGTDRYNGFLGYGHNTDRMVFGTDTSTRMSLDSDGLKFGSDTAAANALDDYEEGTWVPTIDIGGSTTGITYSDQQGLYTKIGNIVIAQCIITLSNKGSSTGVVRIDGLPFNAITPNTRPANAGVLVSESATSSWPQTTTYGLTWNDGYIYLRQNGTGGWAAINNTHLTNTSAFYWSSTFRVS